MVGAEFDGAPPRPAKGYVTYSLAWLQWALPLVRNVNQLVILQVIYRQCLMALSRTVALPSGELKELGVSPDAKDRALVQLKAAGAVSVTGGKTGRAVRVTLLRFP